VAYTGLRGGVRDHWASRWLSWRAQSLGGVVAMVAHKGVMWSHGEACIVAMVVSSGFVLVPIKVQNPLSLHLPHSSLPSPLHIPYPFPVPFADPME